MGVPQRRERVFFIGKRKSLKLPKLNLNFNEKPIKYGEFKDSNFIPLNVETKTYKLWHQRKHGDRNLAYILKRVEGRFSRFNEAFFYDEKVCPTIASSGGYLRFDVPGRPSAKDFKTIQTFPQDYDFNGQNVQYVCGMSVPPIMMQKIAIEIKKQLLEV